MNKFAEFQMRFCDFAQNDGEHCHSARSEAESQNLIGNGFCNFAQNDIKLEN